MNTQALPKCPQCGAVLPPAAPAGLCPRCLMALNLKTETAFSGESPAVQPPLPPEQIAPHFPQLEIIECLGRGGMGVVYKARQKTLNRFVALKLLAPERVSDPKFAERFAREAQALAALNHPNIVTIHDFGQAGGFYFLLMEFVDGVNLRHLLRTRKFTPEEALAIVPTLCDALQFAHERGIVHRDIKPENILLDKSGRVKVADFGIAKMLGNGSGDAGGAVGSADNATQNALGTPGYIAPEQQSDPRRVDSRADIYSLGVVFYEMLTGELPGRKIEPPSHKVQIDVRLDEIVLRALEQRPELRYQQASVLKTQVETIVQGGTRPGGEMPPPYWMGYEYKSKRTLFGLPLLHVASGIDPRTGKAREARGIVAIGGVATGFLAMGGRAYGIVAFGGLTMGVLSFGGLSMGVLSFGGLSVALILAIGGLAVAPVATGGLAIGYLAMGGLALGHFATGGLGVGPNVFDSRHHDWNSRHALMAIGLGPLIAVLWMIFGCLLVFFLIVSAWARKRSVLVPATGGSKPAADKLGRLLWITATVVTGAAVLILTCLVLILRPLHLQFDDVPASIASTDERNPKPTRLRTISDGPVVAQLPGGGSVELLAVHLWPATNSPWWHPDGSAAAYGANIVPQNGGQIGDGMIGLVKTVWPAISEQWPHRESEDNSPAPALGTGLWMAKQDGRTFPMDELAVMPFVQVLPTGDETTLRLNVATARWQTLLVVKTGVWGRWFSGPALRDWRISQAADGSLTVKVTHLIENPATEYRLVAVDTDGMEHLPSRSETQKVSTENFSTREYTFGLVPGYVGGVRISVDHLREVRWQSRPYEAVEFRHVSLVPGHPTRVEVKDFDGDARKTVELEYNRLAR